MAEGIVEVTLRRSGEVQKVPPDQVIALVQEIVERETPVATC